MYNRTTINVYHVANRMIEFIQNLVFLQVVVDNKNTTSVRDFFVFILYSQEGTVEATVVVATESFGYVESFSEEKNTPIHLNHYW